MCGRIQQLNKLILPGDPLRFIKKSPFYKGTGIYGIEGQYNARGEKIKQYLQTWMAVRIPVEGFYEGDHFFDWEVSLGGLLKDNHILIVTVPANDEVKRWHHRMPLILNLVAA